LLLKFEELFDGMLGDWKLPPVSFELKEGAKPYHGRPYITNPRIDWVKPEIATIKVLRVNDCGVNLIILNKHKIQLRVNLVFILYWNSVYVVTFVYTCCANICLIHINSYLCRMIANEE